MQGSVAIARQEAQGYRDRMLAAMPVKDRQMEPAGIPTAVLEGGDGPPIILLHGAGEFAATWMRIIPELASTHRIVAPDLPGHGASGIPDEPLDADRMMDWLADLIEATCHEPPILAGHLLGGALAIRYVCESDAPSAPGYAQSNAGADRKASLEPSSRANSKPSRPRAASLVLVDTFGLAPLRPSLRFVLALAGYMALPNERTQDHLFRRCFVDFDGLRDELGEQWGALSGYALHCARTPAMKTALRHLMPQIAMSAIPSEELASIRVPTSLIWGRHDLQVRLQVAREASERYGWPLHVIDHAADDPAFEQPGAFLDALRTELVIG